MSNPDASEFRLELLVKDPEIGARILGQVTALQPGLYLTKDREDDFWRVLFDVLKKLQTTKYHADRCALLVNEAVANASPPTTGAQHVDHTSGIESEVEAFMLQSKATLDVLSKLLRPLAGIRLPTFGDKGDTVVRALRRNVPDDRKDRAEQLARMIEQDQGWLKTLIDRRDTVDHFRALPSTGVVSQRIRDQVHVREPAGEDGVSFTSVVATSYFNLLTFAEDFVALALNLAMPPPLEVIAVRDSDRADWSQHKYAIAPRTP